MDLVLVHLGPAKAPHVIGNIKHLKREFPESKITLISTKDSHPRIESIQGIEHFKYIRAESDRRHLELLSHNKIFRNGFWVHSLERIYALNQWSLSQSIGQFLHIESDVLVMPTFPLKEIEEFNKLHWTKFNSERDVATFIFSPNKKEFDWLTNEVMQEVITDAHTTDMSALSRIAKKNPKRIDYFPSKPNKEDSTGIGLYDPAAFGMWLTGQDPRNHKGFLIKYCNLSDSEIQPEQFNFKFGGNRLIITKNGKPYLLHNLHIHSKRRIYFTRWWKIALRIDALLSKKRIFHSTISPNATISIIMDFHQRHPDLRGKKDIVLRLIGMKAK